MFRLWPYLSVIAPFIVAVINAVFLTNALA